MKKILVLLLLISFVSAQPVEAPEEGGGLQTLWEKIDKNTKATKEASEKVAEMDRVIKDEFQQVGGVIVLGVSMFIGGMWALSMMFTRIRQSRNKTKYEKLIRDYEEKALVQEKHLFDVIKQFNDNIELTNNNLNYFNTVVTGKKVKGLEKNERIKFIIIGLIVGLIPTILIIISEVLGWQML